MSFGVAFHGLQKHSPLSLSSYYFLLLSSHCVALLLGRKFMLSQGGILDESSVYALRLFARDLCLAFFPKNSVYLRLRLVLPSARSRLCFLNWLCGCFVEGRVEKLAMLLYSLSFPGPLRMTYLERVLHKPAEWSSYKVESLESWKWGWEACQLGKQGGFWRGQDWDREGIVKERAASSAWFARSPMTCVEARTTPQTSPKIAHKISRRIWRKLPMIHFTPRTPSLKNQQVKYESGFSDCPPFVLCRCGSLYPWTESRVLRLSGLHLNFKYERNSGKGER